MVSFLLDERKNLKDVHDAESFSMKRNYEQIDDSSVAISRSKRRLLNFQTEPLDANIDYQALKSSLSLLQSRLNSIKRDIRELNSFKKQIWNSDDGKSLQRLVLTNSDYLKEITYKGCFVKCPTIQWNQNFGINLEVLDDESYETINENYEIIKRDKLFK